MTGTTPRQVELARAMCAAMGIDPDAQVRVPCPDGEAGCLVAHYGAAYKEFLWDAKKYIFERSKGLLS